MNNLSIEAKEYQKEIRFRLDLVRAEKINSLLGKPLTEKDNIELDILNELIEHLHTTALVFDDDIPFEVLPSWMVLKVYNELRGLHNKEKQRRDPEYIKVLDDMSRNLFIGIFSV